MEEWKILPHRHGEHIEEGMERIEEWKNGSFTTEALSALRNTKKRERENGMMENRKTSGSAAECLFVVLKNWIFEVQRTETKMELPDLFNQVACQRWFNLHYVGEVPGN